MELELLVMRVMGLWSFLGSGFPLSSAPMSAEEKATLARGQGASPGVATGKIVFTPEDAIRLAEGGEKAILVRIETDSEDTPGLRAAVGIVTTRGGLTSDAAIIARSLGKPCIAGCNTMSVSYREELVRITGGVVLQKGHVVTIDGGRGIVYDG